MTKFMSAGNIYTYTQRLHINFPTIFLLTSRLMYLHSVCFCRMPVVLKYFLFQVTNLGSTTLLPVKHTLSL